MCMSTPKPKKVVEKPVAYLRNPLLDGLAIGGGTAQGRNSLRRDLGSSGAAYVSPYDKPLPTDPAAPSGTGLTAPTTPSRGAAGRNTLGALALARSPLAALAITAKNR
jgi:hypothetical protein